MTKNKPSEPVMMKLGDCASFVNGRAYKQDELLTKGKYKVIRIQNLNKGKFWYFSDLELDEGKYCEKGDLLFAWSATFGPYYWDEARAIYHYHIWRVIPKPDVLDKAFAYYLLLWITEAIKSKASGIAMLHFTKSGMENYLVKIPHIKQQKVIASQLDKQFCEVKKSFESSEKQLADILLLANKQREAAQSHLANIDKVSLGSFLHRIEAGKSIKTLELPARPGQLAILKVSAVSWKEFQPQEAKVISDDYEPDKKHRIKEGDLIISRANTLELVGAAVLVDTDYPQRLLSDKTLRLVIDTDQVIPEFLLHVLRLSEARKHIENNATGSNDSMRNISQKTIRSIPIPLPSKTIQKDLAGQLIKADEAIKNAVQALASIQENLKILPKKLLSQVFEKQ